MSKHLEVRQKYSVTRRIVNSLLGVWKCDETLSLVFDILLQYLQRKPELARTCRGYITSRENNTKLKIARDNVNLILCDLRDYFASRLLVVQTN